MMPEVPELVSDVVAGLGVVKDDGASVFSRVVLVADAMTSLRGGTST